MNMNGRQMIILEKLADLDVDFHGKVIENFARHIFSVS